MTAAELREKFNKDLKELQDTCQHPESEYLEYQWAPGHGTGNIVNVCIFCEKILKD